jgi:beta-glucanase (GH16 family)
MFAVSIADANHDGVCDTLDFNVWVHNFGHSPTSLQQGDFNGDGKVDWADLSVLRTDFGKRASTAPAPPVAGNWRSIFADEFNGHAPDNRYALNIWGDDNPSWGAASVDKNHASVANGILTLTAQRSGNSFVSSQIHSGVDPQNGVHKPRLSFKFGYIEARIDVPNGKGLWPAFWMLPLPNPQFHDDDGEIDIVDNGAGDPGLLSAGVVTNHNHVHDDHVAELSGGFHTIGVDWQADHITWYVDGNAVMTNKQLNTIPQVPEYFILGLQVNDGLWGAPPNSSTHFPARMQVDYVRVWQKA